MAICHEFIGKKKKKKKNFHQAQATRQESDSASLSKAKKTTGFQTEEVTGAKASCLPIILEVSNLFV